MSCKQTKLLILIVDKSRSTITIMPDVVEPLRRVGSQYPLGIQNAQDPDHLGEFHVVVTAIVHQDNIEVVADRIANSALSMEETNEVFGDTSSELQHGVEHNQDVTQARDRFNQL